MAKIQQYTWERLPTESNVAWQAFVTYRDLGIERTIPKAASILGKSSRLLSRWSAKYDWVQRTRDWDSFLDEQRRVGEIEAVKEMGRRHAQISILGLQGVQAVMDEFLRRLDNGIIDAANTSDRAMVTLWLRTLSKLGSLTKVERTARGLPAEVLSVTEMSDEELLAYVYGSNAGSESGPRARGDETQSGGAGGGEEGAEATAPDEG